MKLKDRLSELLKDNNMSQYKLWKISGVSQATLSEILHGNIKNPGKETLEKIAKALNVTVSQLLGESVDEDSDVIIKDLGNGVKVAINKDHIEEFTVKEWDLALKIVKLIRENKPEKE